MRLFLDTNVYIIGAAYPESVEATILQWTGWDGDPAGSVEVIISQELFDQIARVARCISNKDWAGEILGRIWQNLSVRFVLLDAVEQERLELSGLIPREDVGIYLSARNGGAEHFVSSNYELIHSLAESTGEFECLTPSEFVSKYLS